MASSGELPGRSPLPPEVCLRYWRSLKVLLHLNITSELRCPRRQSSEAGTIHLGRNPRSSWCFKEICSLYLLEEWDLLASPYLLWALVL